MKFEVYIWTSDMTRGDPWKWVATSTSDIGEITAACQVLFPDMIGIMIEPVEAADADQQVG